MLLILLGAPGAGKGTQGSLLAEQLGVPKIATGDILREAVRAGTPLGSEARRYMDAGELVPDSVILGLVRDALGAPGGRRAGQAPRDRHRDGGGERDRPDPHVTPPSVRSMRGRTGPRRT